MKTLAIYGSSDDLVEMEGIPGADEFNTSPKGPVVGKYLLGGQMVIYALYTRTWCFAFGQIAEEIPFPDWPIRISQHENGYSTYVEIDVPDNVAVAEMGKYNE